MSTHRSCCCEDDCQGVIGFDIYTTQIQNFSIVKADGRYFNEYAVKSSQVYDHIAFFPTLEYNYNKDYPWREANTPHWLNSSKPALFYNGALSEFGTLDLYAECPWVNPRNVNKDPVETKWITPTGLYLLHGTRPGQYSTSVYYDPSRTTPRYLPEKYKNSSFRTLPKNHYEYGQPVDELLAASVMPHLFTSQPGRFVLQTHSELPGNHYVGMVNGCLACLPYPEDHPNYWANPLNHLSPKTPIPNVSFADFIVASGVLPSGNQLTSRDIADNYIAEPWKNQPIFATGLLGFDSFLNADYGHLSDYRLRTYDRTYTPRFLGELDFLYDSFLKPEVQGLIININNNVVPPGETQIDRDYSLSKSGAIQYPEEFGYVRRAISEIPFSNGILNSGFTRLGFIFPCKLTAYEIETHKDLKPVPSGTSYPLEYNTANSTIANFGFHYTLPWAQPQTWKPPDEEYFIRGENVFQKDDYFPKAAKYMQNRPPVYFKMPKRGRIFTGPLFAQNRWERGGTYFGKYANRGHYSTEYAIPFQGKPQYDPNTQFGGKTGGVTMANWTQAGWLTWSGNTSAPTSLLTDPENKIYFDAEIAAFKKMVDCCKRESKQKNNCVDGKRVTTCTDLGTKIWKEKYPQQLCTDPPPPCGARKLVWSVYETVSGNESLTSYIDDVPLAWGDFILYEDEKDFAGSTYELITRWTRQDYYKNRCDGFDAGVDGTTAGMTWREMQGLEWTPLYPETKSLKKQIFEKEHPEGSPPSPYIAVPNRYYSAILLKRGADGSIILDEDGFAVYEESPTFFPCVNKFYNNKVYTNLVCDLAWIMNRYGYFRSYQGISAGNHWYIQGSTTQTSTPPDVDSDFKNPDNYNLGTTGQYGGTCGTLPHWYWEEDNNNIYYFPNTNITDNLMYTPSDLWLETSATFLYHSWAEISNTQKNRVPQYVWFISCSVPQYHKKSDQPKTIDGINIDGELTGLGHSKNMGLFNPCKLDSYGVSGPETIKIIQGITTPNMTKDVKKAYKLAHGCTHCNESIFVIQMPGNTQRPSLGGDTSVYFYTKLNILSPYRYDNLYTRIIQLYKPKVSFPGYYRHAAYGDFWSYPGFPGTGLNNEMVCLGDVISLDFNWFISKSCPQCAFLLEYYLNDVDPECLIGESFDPFTPAERVQFNIPRSTPNGQSYETLGLTNPRIPYFRKIGMSDIKYFACFGAEEHDYMERWAISLQDGVLFGTDVPFPDKDNRCVCAAGTWTNEQGQSGNLGACCYGDGDCEDGLVRSVCEQGNDGTWIECATCNENQCP